MASTKESELQTRFSRNNEGKILQDRTIETMQADAHESQGNAMNDALNHLG